ncbi:MAG: class I SAM-dependent methyltransferase [Planctomycetota bacterium]|nr:MAG: class I SAM-dependent methyltransferase [Planctomycetota bacterium]REJ95979.1 MAG: class I SAM-dependent methyltransferase [Planctomycetota bacterium]REK21534.1 MAG: class I SAM-dependent methyltransferase [Planctomycetota bacterium]REK39911.1 MAG: class I SAM-dependent methyltransferase [Planctomycetota bacterium]
MTSASRSVDFRTSRLDPLDLSGSAKGNSRGRTAPSLIRPLLRRRVLRALRQVRHGRIILKDHGHRHVLGDRVAVDLDSKVNVHNDRFYRRLALGGSLGAAESYLDGDWDCDDLVVLFRILCRNSEALDAVNGLASSIGRGASRLGHRLSRNTRRGSRHNIHAHYDLGDEFFRLFLDPTMMYSSAMFERPDMSLEEAQISRLDHICNALDLHPADHLLEIGAGWGGLAVHAATNYGCRVTTTTISKNQHAVARQRIANARLGGRVTLLADDYRDLKGRFDHIVSIEMIEAVGHQYLDEYFAQCRRLLKPGGRLLVQSILMPDQYHHRYLKSVDFIQKYIFPGGCLPSVSSLQQAAARSGDLRLVGFNDFAPGYARTLHEWRTRFRSRLEDVRALGYPDRFIRMWDYYFSYCQAAFEERALGVAHLIWEA